MSKRIRMVAAQHVPQTLDEVNHAIAAIGTAQRERDRIAAAMNDELAVIRERYEAQALPHAERIRELTSGVQLYCEAHRSELTQGGKTKTAKLAAGEVCWRTRPPSVVVRGVEMVIEALRAMGLSRFIRVREEINREAILAEPEAVQQVRGIEIRQPEDFVVKPWDTSLEEVA